ncbi:hypothetical protein ACFWD7_29555 [Streptomyces mirabilis]|uniref:hypothetical protein n=1 Tax=Streptomyces mirabilis TaxID=68239 RepID=UPI0036AB243B
MSTTTAMPHTGVYVTPADATMDADAYYTVTASGANAAFCTHVEVVRSEKGD